METVRFFKNLGLLTRREPSVSSAEPSVSPAGTSTKLASAVPTAQSASAAAAGRISRLALVSHDYNVEDSRGLYDYTEHFSQVNHLCDQQGCECFGRHIGVTGPRARAHPACPAACRRYAVDVQPAMPIDRATAAQKRRSVAMG